MWLNVPINVAGEGHIDILEWLSRHNVLPNARGIRLARENNHADVVHWLSDKGIQESEVKEDEEGGQPSIPEMSEYSQFVRENIDRLEGTRVERMRGVARTLA